MGSLTPVPVDSGVASPRNRPARTWHGGAGPHTGLDQSSGMRSLTPIPENRANVTRYAGIMPTGA